MLAEEADHLPCIRSEGTDVSADRSGGPGAVAPRPKTYQFGLYFGLLGLLLYNALLYGGAGSLTLIYVLFVACIGLAGSQLEAWACSSCGPRRPGGTPTRSTP